MRARSHRKSQSWTGCHLNVNPTFAVLAALRVFAAGKHRAAASSRQRIILRHSSQKGTATHQRRWLVSNVCVLPRLLASSDSGVGDRSSNLSRPSARALSDPLFRSRSCLTSESLLPCKRSATLPLRDALSHAILYHFRLARSIASFSRRAAATTHTVLDPLRVDRRKSRDIYTACTTVVSIFREPQHFHGISL